MGCTFLLPLHSNCASIGEMSSRTHVGSVIYLNFVSSESSTVWFEKIEIVYSVLHLRPSKMHQNAFIFFFTKRALLWWSFILQYYIKKKSLFSLFAKFEIVPHVFCLMLMCALDHLLVQKAVFFLLILFWDWPLRATNLWFLFCFYCITFAFCLVSTSTLP